jgi:hypothetical protein
MPSLTFRPFEGNFWLFYISYHLEPLLRRAKGLQAQGLEAVLRRPEGLEAVLRRAEGL